MLLNHVRDETLVPLLVFTLPCQQRLVQARNPHAPVVVGINSRHGCLDPTGPVQPESPSLRVIRRIPENVHEMLAPPWVVIIPLGGCGVSSGGFQ